MIRAFAIFLLTASLCMAQGQLPDDVLRNLLMAERGAVSTTSITPYSVYFRGTNSYIEANNVATNALFDGNFTMACWVRCAKWGANQAIIGGGRNDSLGNYTMMELNGATHKLIARIGYNPGALENVVESSSSYNNNTNWHHIAMMGNASGHITAFYVDATNQGASSTYTLDTSAWNCFRMGELVWTSHGVNVFQGRIDEAAIWNRALSGTEITNLYNNGNGVYGNISTTPWNTNLRALYHFDDGTGAKLSDISGNNCTGTMVNTVWDGSIYKVTP